MNGVAATSSGARVDTRIRDSTGAPVAAVPRVVRTVGPASYAAGGFQVDCSSFFSSIVSAIPARAFVTATLAPPAAYRIAVVAEVGGNVFTAAKFQAALFWMPSHTHTYDKADTPTGSASSGLAGADPHTHALTYTSTASGAPSSFSLSEVSNGNNVSANTYEFIVWGIPL